MTDWQEWHKAYEDPTSRLSQRLAAVQARLAEAITNSRPGPVRLLSLCAGEGRDTIPVLTDHPRRHDVHAVLVELDGDLADRARQAARHLPNVDIRTADAGTTTAYLDAYPADIVMVCGIFGNISDEDIRTTIHAVADMTTPNGHVLWTRHRYEPDLTPTIRQWFHEAGFDEVAFDSPEGTTYAVGTNRRRPDQPRRLFEFVR